ncbi:MAG TPA: hypothetical protein VMV83_08900 [Rectinemataceae bacterium]|nr:hypothetical protein [Rectinemataceae bacterium]
MRRLRRWKRPRAGGSLVIS